MGYPDSVEALTAAGFSEPPKNNHVPGMDVAEIQVAVHCASCNEVIPAFEGPVGDAIDSTGEAECPTCGGTWETTIDPNQYGELFGQMIESSSSGEATMYWKLISNPPDELV